MQIQGGTYDKALTVSLETSVCWQAQLLQTDVPGQTNIRKVLEPERRVRCRPSQTVQVYGLFASIIRAPTILFQSLEAHPSRLVPCIIGG